MKDIKNYFQKVKDFVKSDKETALKLCDFTFVERDEKQKLRDEKQKFIESNPKIKELQDEKRDLIKKYGKKKFYLNLK